MSPHTCTTFAPTHLDLFAGWGGFSLSAKDAGMRTVAAVENDPYACATYRANFAAPVIEEDIRKVGAGDLPVEGADVVTAGFPCQPFSQAGARMGFADPRGTLFGEALRIAREVGALVIVLENVPGLLSHDNGRTFAHMRAVLHDQGYSVEAGILGAEDYVPQRRPRLFAVAWKTNFLENSVGMQGHASVLTGKRKFRRTHGGIRSVLEPHPDPKYTLGERTWQSLIAHRERHKAKGHGYGYRLYSGTDIVGPLVTRHTNGSHLIGTISSRYAKDGADALIDTGTDRPRRLTPRECARLMGMPDTWRIPVSDFQAYRQAGNAVVAPLAADILWRIGALLQGRRNGV